MERNKFKWAGEHRHPIDWIAEANALISGIALFPQVWKSLHSPDRSQLSLPALLLIVATSIIWILYGLHRKSFQVMISSALSLLAGLLLMVLALGYL